MSSAGQGRRLKICIIAHAACGALVGGSEGHAGGVERQTSMLAHWLADRGHDVSFITWDEGEVDRRALHNVKLIRLCRADAGWPGLRFFHPRWISLNRALRQADADLYYQNGAEYVTGQIALWCKQNNRKFIFSSASDFDCDPQLPELRKLRERILYRYGLQNASRLIVQTQKQQDMMLRFLGLSATVLPMPCPGPGPADYSPPSPPDGGARSILWVGRISAVKRLDLLLDVAALLPQFNFEVAGARDGDDPGVETALARAAARGNLRMHGKVPRAKIAELYRDAALLCCTSSTEGFPNTFLEAWSHGVPVVTTIDPDDLVTEERMGVVAGDATAIASSIKRLIEDSSLWLDCSRNARSYYLRNHNVDHVMAMFEQVFLETVGTTTSQQLSAGTRESSAKGLSA
jgi:glycosyltransferase involved in cell wall biosynthesis